MTPQQERLLWIATLALLTVWVAAVLAFFVFALLFEIGWVQV